MNMRGTMAAEDEGAAGSTMTGCATVTEDDEE